MAKRKLLTRIAAGAVAGGLLALTDKEVRAYVKAKAGTAKMYAVALMKNPVGTIGAARLALIELSEKVDGQASEVMNALGQVQETVEKFRSGVPEQKKLEAPE